MKNLSKVRNSKERKYERGIPKTTLPHNIYKEEIKIGTVREEIATKYLKRTFKN